MTHFTSRQQWGLLLILGAILILQAVRHLPLPDPGPESLPGRAEAASPGQGALFLAGHPLDLNRANLDELTLLPGIGPKRAAAIIRYRAQKKGLGSLDELGEIPGFGPKLIERLRRIAFCGPLAGP